MRGDDQITKRRYKSIGCGNNEGEYEDTNDERNAGEGATLISVSINRSTG